jgi:hypothetical protein
MGDFLAWFSMSIANSMQKPNYNKLWTASVYVGVWVISLVEVLW